MKEINEEARERYYDEVGIHLTRAGFSVLPKEDGLLPLEWNGVSLCRITAGGGAQFRAEELEPEGASPCDRHRRDNRRVYATHGGCPSTPGAGAGG